MEAPLPKDVSQLRSFLGLVNYYDTFMPNQQNALAPLNQLLQKSRKWIWGSAQSKAFQAAKEALTSATVLMHYNSDLNLVHDCDTSPYGVGAVLSVGRWVNKTNHFCQSFPQSRGAQIRTSRQGGLHHCQWSENVSPTPVWPQVYQFRPQATSPYFNQSPYHPWHLLIYNVGR